MKSCSKCKKRKADDQFYKNRLQCNTCRKANQRVYHASWRVRNAHRLSEHYRETRLRQYGLTGDTYAAMLRKQKYRCAICRTKEPGGVSGIFNIDHCHKTKKVRGLLCMACNIALGKFKDSPKLLHAAITYLSIGNNHD